MAELKTAAVSLYPPVTSAGFVSAEQKFGYPANSLLQRSLKLVLTGQGGQTNVISATALGFARLTSCTPLLDKQNNLVYVAVVDPVANTLVLKASGSGSPVDITSNEAYITLTGFPFTKSTSPIV